MTGRTVFSWFQKVYFTSINHIRGAPVKTELTAKLGSRTDGPVK
jgi:hypothetical protein